MGVKGDQGSIKEGVGDKGRSGVSEVRGGGKGSWVGEEKGSR